MPSPSPAIAIGGLLAAIAAVELPPYLGPSDIMDGAQAALLGGAAVTVLLLSAAIISFFAAVTFMYVHIHNGGGGGVGAAAAKRWVLEAVAFILSASIGLVELSPHFDQLSTMDGAQPVLLDGAAVQMALPLAALVAFFAALMHIYLHVHNGGGGGVGGPGNRPMPETVTFALSVSVALLELFLFPQPAASAMDDDGSQTPSLGEAAVHMLLPAATVTFFLSISLIYVHIRTVVGSGGDDAENERIPADLGLLAKATLAATLVTVVLSFIAVLLPFKITK